ncbi:uncharacterized protein LOC113231289 isoform X2 [Hyposmocoma kahamanoa]|uniref:uncharacterized protein LOC113231289 isoform X2 n=1 Tax=Hyposmocoma kahamanoa TaxID=1477025 RepID=UPI000E6D6C9D|nr:uncharacterized protein LOC113231289 isoform X2 [Hyposmocoma kahamanoa]
MQIIKMVFKLLTILSLIAITYAQRPWYAGSKPIGYPSSPENNAPATTDELQNKSGDDDSSTTTQSLPIEAQGDRDLVNRISKLPVDQQPFWYINWQALEAQRQNPQTWPHKPNGFSDNQDN